MAILIQFLLDSLNRVAELFWCSVLLFQVAGLHTPRHYPGQNCCLPVRYYALDGLINTDRIQCQVMNDAFVSEPESSYQFL
ncbi:hypothetical protein VNO77_17770 [Canavalia gladiata]|uniref:Secreted protein n=1 Tax=Canavalia gladiata TaxID=3824 RepID=A0AAN9LND8_CANGL